MTTYTANKTVSGLLAVGNASDARVYVLKVLRRGHSGSCLLLKAGVIATVDHDEIVVQLIEHLGLRVTARHAAVAGASPCARRCSRYATAAGHLETAVALLANFLGALHHVPLVLRSCHVVHAILLVTVLIVSLAVSVR